MNDLESEPFKRGSVDEDNMNANATTQQPPLLPRRIHLGGGSILLWAIGGLFCSFAALLLVLTFLLPGGPIEPPSDMPWEEFEHWVDSGAWFWDSMKTCAKCAALGVLLIAMPFVRLSRARKIPS